MKWYLCIFLTEIFLLYKRRWFAWLYGLDEWYGQRRSQGFCWRGSRGIVRPARIPEMGGGSNEFCFPELWGVNTQRGRKEGAWTPSLHQCSCPLSLLSPWASLCTWPGKLIFSQRGPKFLKESFDSWKELICIREAQWLHRKEVRSGFGKDCVWRPNAAPNRFPSNQGL